MIQHILAKEVVINRFLFKTAVVACHTSGWLLASSSFRKTATAHRTLVLTLIFHKVV